MTMEKTTQLPTMSQVILDVNNAVRPLSIGSPAQAGQAQEFDPTGRDPKQAGAKLDAGKPCVWRGAVDYFPNAIRAVATVSTFGASKYFWKGWSTVPEGFERYSDAMVRHLIAESAEGAYDNDSGLLHAAHCAWGALARLEFLLREKELRRGAN